MTRIPVEWRDTYQVEGDPLMMVEDYLEPPPAAPEAERIAQAMNHSWVLRAGIVRGLIAAGIVFLVAAVLLWFFIALLSAILVALNVAVIVLLVRLIEAMYDARRAAHNDIRRHDVGAFSNPIHDGQRTG